VLSKYQLLRPFHLDWLKPPLIVSIRGFLIGNSILHKKMASSPPRELENATFGEPAPERVLSQAQPEGETGMGPAGTSVATETCGQLRPLKFSKTICEY